MDEGKEIFEIFAGTYEEYLLGFKLSKIDNEYSLKQMVADHSHKGSLRAISTRGNLLATGGFDEVIRVYNLDDNREIGTLAQHSGTVTCLTFTSDEKHLISCSEDGSIAIYRVGSWIMEKLWTKAHKGQYVNWIAVHPSNKMALTVGNDSNIRTWNLITGTPAFNTDISYLSKRPELIVWSPDGQHHAVPHENEISVFTVETASVQHSFKLKTKITSAHFFKDEILCAGDMSGNIAVFNLESGVVKQVRQISEARIKAITSHDEHLVVATSNGLVAVYEIEEGCLQELAKCECSCRITCLTVSCLCHRREKKQKKKKTGENGDIKMEINDELKSKLKKKNKNSVKIKVANNSNSKNKVECFPKRQSWIVEVRDD